MPPPFFDDQRIIEADTVALRIDMQLSDRDRLIALHPLGTFVPGGNDPVRAEGKYGVLGGPLDEQLESICGVERSVRADRFIGKRRPNPGPSLDVSTG